MQLSEAALIVLPAASLVFLFFAAFAAAFHHKAEALPIASFSVSLRPLPFIARQLAVVSNSADNSIDLLSISSPVGYYFPSNNLAFNILCIASSCLCTG